MTTNLTRLKEAQQAILLAEVGALLHNLGKVARQFFEMQSETGSLKYRYQHILRFIISDYLVLGTDFAKLADALNERENQGVVRAKTVDLLKTTFSLPPPFNDRPYRIGDLIEYLGQGPKEIGNQLYNKADGDYWIERIFPDGARLLHLLNRAHGAASGGDKQDIWKDKQPSGTLYRATPMGWEELAPDLDQVDALRAEVEDLLERFLDPPAVLFPARTFAKELRNYLEPTLADTRRPVNDISVWDMGRTGAAFVKAGIATYVLSGQSLSHDDLAADKDANKLFWRVLGCRLNGLDYLEKALSVAEIRARYRLLTEKLDILRDMLETLPLATEVYRDENGSFYLFPDVAENGAVPQEIQQLLDPLLPIDGVALSVQLSKPLVGHPDDDTSAPYLGRYIQEQGVVQPTLRHHLPDYAAWKTDAGEICTACRVRPQGYGAKDVADYAGNPRHYREKALARNICCICMDRHRGASQTWCSDLGGTTIWIDEASDHYGRMALVVGRFRMQEFLTNIQYPKVLKEIEWQLELDACFLKDEPSDGMTITLGKQGTFHWDAGRRVLVGPKGKKREVPKQFERDQIHIHKPFSHQVTIVDVTFDPDDGYKLHLEEDLPLALPDKSACRVWGQEFIVIERRVLCSASLEAASKVETEVLWGEPAAPLYIKRGVQIPKGALSQSFARISRVWETTRCFWQKALDLQDDKDQPTIPKIDPRLEIRGELRPNKPGDSLGLFHVYELVLGHTKLSAVWDSDHNRFISADNLDYVMSLLGSGLTEALTSRPLTIEEPAGYGSKNKVWGRLANIQVTSIVDENDLPLQYTPAIPLLAEPRTFMALVPADRALTVVRAISREYRRQMGKVRSRLPLSLGIVYAPRRTPLRALLDAGRRMFDVPAQSVHWSLSRDAQVQDDKIELAFNNGQIWHVRARMGDGTTDDLWYPYFLVDTGGDDFAMAQRALAFKDARPASKDWTPSDWFVHARELRQGDRVWIAPSTFDFEFLDTTARRFEISYTGDGRRRGRPTRPFLLDDLDRLDRLWERLIGLTTTQLQNLEGLLVGRLTEWHGLNVAAAAQDETYCRFAADVLTRLDKGWWRGLPPEEQDELTLAAQSGELLDLLELHLHILKEKTQADLKVEGGAS